MDETKPSRWKRTFQYFSNHPIVFLIILAGAIASMYYGIWPKYPQRELTYAIQPVRTAIVEVNQASDISVSYKGKPIKGDLSAAQIVVANAGKEPIEAKDILVPITLVTSNAEILECSFSKPPLAGTEFTLATNLPTSRLGMSWRVLEQADNPIIQLVYAGKRDATILLEGRIVGQSSPHQVSWPTKTRVAFLFRCTVWGQIVCFMVLGCLELCFPDSRPKPRKLRSVQLAVWLVVVMVLIFNLVMSLYFASPTPFGH